MDEEGLPARMFRAGCEPSGRKRVNSYFTLRWIETIKAALDSDHLERLAESQFASVMQMGHHTFSVMFVHYLMSRQLVTKKKYELWWLFAGKPIRYGVEDFAQATGLNCKSPVVKSRKRKSRVDPGKKGKKKEQVVEEKGKMWTALFGKRQKVTTDYLMDMLNMGRKGKDGITRFQLALLLLVEGILCTTSGSTNVRTSVVEMLADVEKFMCYPWGRESFLLTVRSAKARAVNQWYQDSTSVQGFSHAMVLVTCCCCPELIRRVGERDPVMTADSPIEDVIQCVVERSLSINVQTARNIDQRGQAKVRSLLSPAGDPAIEHIPFQDEVDDERVDHLITLISEDFPFEHNSWRGGVTEEDANEHKDMEVDETDDSVDISEGSENASVKTSHRAATGKGKPRNANGCCKEGHSGSPVEPQGGSTKSPIRECDGAMRRLFREMVDAYEERATGMYEAYTVSVKEHVERSLEKLKKDLVEMLKSGPSAGPAGAKSTTSIPEVSGNGVEKAGRKRFETVNTKVGRTDEDTNSAGVGGCSKDTTFIRQGCKELKDAEGVTRKLSKDDGHTSDVSRGHKEGLNEGIGGNHVSKEAPDFSKGDPISVSYEEDGIEESDGGQEFNRDAVVVDADNIPIAQTYRNSLRGKTNKNNKAAKTESKVKGKLLTKRGGNVVTGKAKTVRTVVIATPDVSQLVGGFSPFASPSLARETGFLNLIRAEKSYAVGEQLALPSTPFLEIYQSRGPLSEFAVDLLVRFVQLRGDDIGKVEWDFMPPTFFSALRREYEAFVLSTTKGQHIFSPLVHVPVATRQRWCAGVSVLYTMYQVDGYHWVGVVVDLNEFAIYVLDCNTACLSDDELTRKLQPVAEMLPHYLRQHGDTDGSRLVPLQTFPVKRMDVSMLCEITGLSAVASVILLELHALGKLSDCGKLSEGILKYAACNYAIEAFAAFHPTLL